MYKLIKSQTTGEICAVNTVVGDVIKSIPFDPANTDYQEYLKWLEAGNTPEAADE